MVTLIGGHRIRCQTARQTVPALSSGEAEYVGNVKGGSVGIGMQSMARDFGDERAVSIATGVHFPDGGRRCVGTLEVLVLRLPYKSPEKTNRKQQY